MNNKNLALIFGGLLAVYLLSKLLGGNRERSFDPTIVEIDTSKVTRVEIQPSQQGTPFTLQRGNGTWTIESAGKTFSATSSSIRSLLSNLVSIEADRVVSKNPEKYIDYGLDDQSRTTLKLFSDNKEIGGVDIGRFNYNQATRNGISYIKRATEPEVFSVEGFLSMTLNQAMDNYRDKRVVQTNKSDLTRVTYKTSSGELVYSLNNGSWVNAENQRIDSTKMDRYLNGLSSVSGNAFVDDPEQIGAPVGELMIEGNNMTGPLQVQCFASRDSSHHFVIASSSNTEGKFFSDSSGIYRRLINDLLEITVE